MSALHKVHFETTKHVLHYIKRTQEFGIFNEVGNINGLHRFTNEGESVRNGNQQ
jgi:hypothetical protein